MTRLGSSACLRNGHAVVIVGGVVTALCKSAAASGLAAKGIDPDEPAITVADAGGHRLSAAIDEL